MFEGSLRVLKFDETNSHIRAIPRHHFSSQPNQHAKVAPGIFFITSAPDVSYVNVSHSVFIQNILQIHIVSIFDNYKTTSLNTSQFLFSYYQLLILAPNFLKKIKDNITKTL